MTRPVNESSRKRPSDKTPPEVPHVVEKTGDDQGLVELFPFGVNLIGEGARPVLLLRDGQGQLTLSVPLSPIEAGVALSQSNRVAKPISPHRGTLQIFKSLKLEILRCVFIGVENHRQMVRLEFSGHPSSDQLVMSADEALSLVLYLEVPVFASPRFVRENQLLLASLEGMAEAVKLNPGTLKRDHVYIQ